MPGESVQQVFRPALNLARAAEEAKQASGSKRERAQRQRQADEMI